MDLSKLKIVSPCSQDFDQMEGEGHRRFCDQCDKHVHNLSDLNRAEALELIRKNKGDMCVVYTFDSSNRIRFRDDLGFKRPSKAQLGGLKKLLAAAAVIPLLATLPACDVAPTEEPPSMLAGYQADHEPSDFRPIDDLMAAERRFVDHIKDLLGFVPEYEMVAGAPMVEPVLLGELEVVPEPVEPEQIEPNQIEPEYGEVMGDLAMDPDLLD